MDIAEYADIYGMPHRMEQFTMKAAMDGLPTSDNTANNLTHPTKTESNQVEPQEIQEAICPPLLLNMQKVCSVLGIGISCLNDMRRSGQLGPQVIKLRGRRLWSAEELACWIKAGCPRREVWQAMKNEGAY